MCGSDVDRKEAAAVGVGVVLFCRSVLLGVNKGKFEDEF